MSRIIYFFKIKVLVFKVFKKYNYKTRDELLSEELNEDITSELHSILNELLLSAPNKMLYKYIIISFFKEIRSYLIKII